MKKYVKKRQVIDLLPMLKTLKKGSIIPLSASNSLQASMISFDGTIDIVYISNLQSRLQVEHRLP